MSWLKNLFSCRKKETLIDKTLPGEIPPEKIILDIEYMELWYIALKTRERTGEKIAAEGGTQGTDAYMESFIDKFDFKNIMIESIRLGKSACDAAFNLFKQGLVSMASCIQCLSTGNSEDFITISRNLLDGFNKIILPLAHNIDNGKTIGKGIDFWIFETEAVTRAFPAGEEDLFRQIVEISMRPLLQLINSFRSE